MAPVIIIMIFIRTRALSLVQQEKNGINKIIVILITNGFFYLQYSGIESKFFIYENTDTCN